MDNWQLFFTATAGAAAVLTGLIFVGVSINLQKIVSSRALPTRAKLALNLLLANLIFSLIFLIPNQTIFNTGIKILILGIVIWAIAVKWDLSIYREGLAELKKVYVLNIALNQLCLLIFITGAILMLSNGEIGIYMVAAGIFVSFVKAIIEAWILLVEIDR